MPAPRIHQFFGWSDGNRHSCVCQFGTKVLSSELGFATNGYILPWDDISVKLASVIAILAFVALPALRATPIDLTATSLSFACGGQSPCGYYYVSGPGFAATFLGGGVISVPGDYMELPLLGAPFLNDPPRSNDLGSTLTVGNTSYDVSARGPTLSARMTSTTNFYNDWSASGPATATGEISVCAASVELSGGTCDPALAFALINLNGLQGTLSESWYDVAGNPADTTWAFRGGSLSATPAPATPEPLSAGFAFAGLLFLAAYRRWRSKTV